jgi:hypothetical protein
LPANVNVEQVAHSVVLWVRETAEVHWKLLVAVVQTVTEAMVVESPEQGQSVPTVGLLEQLALKLVLEETV